jgi:hypothetical protein
MLPLSEGELVQMRAELSQTLPGTAVIHTATKASDGQGGFTWTYSPSGTVAARLSPEALRGGEQEIGGRIAEVGQWILTVPRGTTIDEDDRVVYDGVTYEVSEVLTREPWEISRRVRLTEVD